jgi:hypothetical protein
MSVGNQPHCKYEQIVRIMQEIGKEYRNFLTLFNKYRSKKGMKNGLKMWDKGGVQL